MTLFANLLRQSPVIAAFASAVFASAAVGTAMMMTPTALPIALVITAILTAIIGLPLYAILRSRLPRTWWSAVLVGYAIGVVPIALLSLASVPDFASSGGVVTAENGIRTVAGWSQLITFALISGLPGAVGGLAFWGTLKATGALTKGDPSPHRRWLSGLIVSLVLLGSGFAFALPTIMMDRSCHNSARDGRRSVTPELVAELDVGPEEWAEVRALMQDFSDDHDWSFRESLAGSTDSYAAFQVSVCTEPGVAFRALQHYGNPAAFPPLAPDDPGPRNMAMMITVTQEQSGAAWRKSGKAFFDRLQARYGSRLTFENAEGQTISRSAAEAGPYRQD